MTTPSTHLRRRRAVRIRQLRSMPLDFLRGCLVEPYKRCGKAGCKCAAGRGHGPNCYLSVSFPGRGPEMIYVRQDEVKRVAEYLGNRTAVRAVLGEICQINRALLQQREAF